MVSSRGGKWGYVTPSRQHAYKGMPKTLSKKSRARIANAGKTHAARVRMAKKGARTRKRRHG